MESIFITLLLSFFLSLLLLKILPVIVQKIIDFKEEQKRRKYERYDIQNEYINYFYFILLFITIFYNFMNYKVINLIYFNLLTYLGIIIIDIDRRIRIIPNELVLIIFLLGFIVQLMTKGLLGLLSGFIAMLISLLIFLITAKITQLISGTLGVGGGDIKLVMAISLLIGKERVLDFLFCIVISLAIYFVYGFSTKIINKNSTFPMAVQIIGGFLILIYQPLIELGFNIIMG